MEHKTVGFAVCGSFCTHHRAMEALEAVKARYDHVIPIVSEVVADTDTRFGTAHDLMREMERICDHRVIATQKEAEPIGPKGLLDLLIIAPCTGSTLGKLACGIADTTVTLAAKAHLRNCRPILLAPSTNDGLAASARNLGQLMARKYIYLVPFRQDDPEEKPASLVADFSLVADAAQAALEGRQLQRVLGAPGAPCAPRPPTPPPAGMPPPALLFSRAPPRHFGKKKHGTRDVPVLYCWQSPDELSAIRHRADKEVSHMDRGMKKWIYWGVYVFLTLAGFLACIFRLLPVVTPSVFLLGLYNLWQGVAWALHLYPYVPQHHSRRRQLLFSAACICLGIVWVPLSLTSWSTQWGPLIASILPSLILAFASSRCRG